MVDDLVDSGLTLQTVRDRLLAAGAASVKACVLLDKRARRKVCGCWYRAHWLIRLASLTD
jgi:hypoxanthine-guanine phosphoribosyltransferase